MAYWEKLRSRGHVEDRRSAVPLARGVGGLGVVGTLLYLAFTYFASGGDMNVVLSQLGDPQQLQQSGQRVNMQGADQYQEFASTVLGSSNDLWQQVFSQNGQEYQPPRLVLFRQATQSGCGYADSQVGPHYCPNDQTIYLDETFFDELQRRFKAKGGDVAEAYVIAHEVGHHVQNILGVFGKLQQGDREAAIQVELQADCFAGVWAYSVARQNVFEPGEVNEALDAAAAVGDDRIQKEMTGSVHPETWTHGSSAQRVEWFNRGFSSGQPSRCEI